jgi:transglutaminase/protease-like cytokinesis protein 3
MKNPVPVGGFKDFESEKAYARKIHDFIARKVTYSPIGYDPESLFGMRNYEALQEAYNALAETEDSAVCSGYARAFALIAQYAGINAAWVYGNETGTGSHAWNVVYPCDGSEPVLVDVTWDDTESFDSPGQEHVSGNYFYIPLSNEHEHTPAENFGEFLRFMNNG